MEDRKLTFIEHLEELRASLIKSIVFIITVSCLAYAFKDAILRFLVKPIGKLVFISPQEAFVTNLKIAFLSGVYLSLPFLFYQGWRFISKGLEDKEKRYAMIFGIFSFANFILGSLFGYFIIVPIGMKFLLSFSRDFIVPMISMDRYVAFMGSLVFAFGIVFQVPLAVLFFTKLGMITPEILAKNRKYAVVIIFIIGAGFTPPDIITQCLMAVPLLLLYELSIWLSKMTGHRGLQKSTYPDK